MEFSCFAGVIPAQRLDLITKRAADQGLEQMGQRRMGLQIGFGYDKVVPSGLERDEVEPEELRSGSNPDPYVSLTACDRARNIEMSGDDRVVAPYLMIFDSRRAQPLIQ
jgi:hypothetical protein